MCTRFAHGAAHGAEARHRPYQTLPRSFDLEPRLRSVKYSTRCEMCARLSRTVRSTNLNNRERTNSWTILATRRGAGASVFRRGPALGGPVSVKTTFSRLQSPPYALTPSKTALPTALTQGLPRCTLKLSAQVHRPHWQRSRCSSGMLWVEREHLLFLPDI